MASIFQTKALPSKPRSRRAKFNADSWAWEILSCTLSIITTVTVGVVVFMYNGKPVPKLPFNFGLNSVISIIGTVSKSALLLTITSCISQYKWMNFTNVDKNNSLQDLQFHDEASRGPWGSFMLLVNWKGLYWVKLGALITMISMAFDPMYQALIQVEQRPRYQDDSNVIVKRALNFDQTNYLKNDKKAYFSTDWYRAIINAISSDTMIVDTNPPCPTGNCTFPIFSSLAFCSNCIDIQQTLQHNSKCTQNEGLNGGETPHTSFLQKTTNCTYWLPLSSSGQNYSIYEDGRYQQHKDSSITLSWMFREEGHPFTDAPSFSTGFLALDEDFNAPFHISDRENISSHFTAMVLIKFAPQDASAAANFLNEAHICALSICAKEYNTSMTSGLFRTETVSTSYSHFDGHHYDGDLRKPVTPSYRFTFPDSNNNFNVVSHNIDSGFATEVVISSNFEGKVEDVLRQVFGGTLRLDSDWDQQDSWFAQTTNIFLAGLNTSTNIPKTMDRVAAAMSNHLRDISNFTISGQSGFMELYIRVSWWWLLLPALTVIFETMLLISIMIMTRKHQLPIWKTSELAFFFHGLDLSSLTGDPVKMLKASEMDDIASALQVRFGRDSERGGVLKLKRMPDEEE